MTVPDRYRPDERITDKPARLRELYCDRGLTIREIAQLREVEVGRTMVHEALREYDIITSDVTDAGSHAQDGRGFDPPSPTDDAVQWSQFATAD